MKPEIIKVGDKVLVEAEVTSIHDDGNLACATLYTAYDGGIDKTRFDVLRSSVRKMTDNTDPCRLLCKGDKVQVVERNGRCNGKYGEYLREAFCKVAEDEVPNELVRVLHNATEYRLDPAYLKLIDPVEELEPDEVQEDVEKSVYPRHDKTNGIKNTETAPKYDPCRKFREGDIVEPCQVKGRWFGTAWKDRRGIRFTVTKDEDEEGVMWVQDPDSLHSKDVEAVFFQLVVPVEELEPYFVAYDDKFYHVHKKGEAAALAVYYEAKHPHAKEAAEAERDRLNAEHRKERKNGRNYTD